MKFFKVLLLLFSLTLNAQYTQNIDWRSFVGDIGGGGSYSVLTINSTNNTISLSFSAGFGNTPLANKYVCDIGYTGSLPDMILGTINTADVNFVSPYKAVILNKKLYVYSDSFPVINSLSGTINASLITPVPVNNDISNGLSQIFQNFVKTTDYLSINGDSGSKRTTMAYYDNLGRKKQEIIGGYSNSGNDIIKHLEYDELGRQVKDFLPYPSSAPSLNYVERINVLSQASAYYGESNPFTENLMEMNQTEGKVLKTAFPGNSWAMNSGHEIKSSYLFNTNDEVKKYSITTNWNSTKGLYEPTISEDGYYQSNQLYKNTIEDENNGSGNYDYSNNQEFKNIEGNVILKRVYTINSKGIGNNYDTYYIYDKFGNLTYILPPLTDGAIDQNTLDGLCYQYKYDNKNRIVAKKLPGKQWEYIVYDKLDRPVASGPVYSTTGDGSFGVLITEYDTFGRTTQTGWKSMTIDETTRGSLQNSINTGGTPFTLSANEILTKNFYDNYGFAGAPSVATPYITNAKGLQTGSWIKVIDPLNVNASEFSYTLYDFKYRPIVVHTNNYLGGYTRVETTLDWAGKVLQTLTKHKRLNGDIEIIVTDTFDYTAQDRLSLHKHRVNSQPEQLIAKNTYDEIGRLISKNVGGTNITGNTGLQKVDYSYNIRGWLTGINNVTNLNEGSNPKDLFAFKIGYDNHTDIGVNDYEPTLLYNGNISETYWQTASDEVIRKYDYTYDMLNRFVNANYAKPNSASAMNSYSETVGYDKNGNIQFLYRNGDLDSDGSSPENLIDDLVYTYDPIKKNQLMKVFDMSNNPGGFVDDTVGLEDPTDDYQYDDNGNTIKDDNKQITDIDYNHLNLPVKITFASGNKIEYIYNAIGTKVGKKVIEGTLSTVIDYLDGFQYRKPKIGTITLDFFPHAEGYVSYYAGVYSYVFNYVDHLGNIRLSYKDTNLNGIIEKANNEIIEENHFYPYGLEHTGYTANVYSNYKVKYNGKELQDELGLNFYDYGARNYEPTLGRWMNIDPLAEKFFEFSPFNYTINNPVKFVDKDGMDVYLLNEGGNFILAKKQSGDDIVFGYNSKTGSLNDNNGDKKINSKDGQTVKTKGLLSQLSSIRKGTDYYQAIAENTEEHEDDLINLFHYSSKNATTVEFSLAYFEYLGKNWISLQTYGGDYGASQSPGWYQIGLKSKNQLKKLYHNHPLSTVYVGTYTERRSMGESYPDGTLHVSGDYRNLYEETYNSPYYVFFPKSTNLYSVTKTSIKLIEQINNNPKKLKR